MGRLQKKKEVQRLGHQGLFAKSEKRLMGSNCLWQVPGNFPWLLFFLRRNLSIGKKGAPHTTILSFFSTRRATLCTVQFWVRISKICFGKGISVYKPRVVSVVIQEIWKTVAVFSKFMFHHRNSRFINWDTFTQHSNFQIGWWDLEQKKSNKSFLLVSLKSFNFCI